MNRQNKLSEFEKTFWQVSRKMSYEWKAIYQEKFPGSQSHIIFLLKRDGQMKMSELAEAINLTPGAVTTSANHLVKNEYIERIQNLKDRRVVYLALTKKGSSALSELQNEGRKIIQTVFKNADNNQLDMMTQLFQQANTNIDKLRKVNEK